MRRPAEPRSWFGLRAHHLRRTHHPIIRNFFEDRCTHLAAMVAYYALLSLLPFLFLLLSLLGLIGEQGEQSYLVQQLQVVLPHGPADEVVRAVDALRDNAAGFGLLGGLGLVWTSLGFLSAVESALNIIYEVPNRSFLHQKLLILAFVGLSLVALFAWLAAITTAYAFLRAHGGTDIPAVDGELAFSIAFSLIVSLAFLYFVYRFLPNTPVRSGEVWPGVVVGAICFQISFQILPFYLRFVETFPALKAFGGLAVLLVWLYLMGNILLAGAQINWWYGRCRPGTDDGSGAGASRT